MKKLLLMSILITSKLYALPTLYPEKFNYSIQNNTNSALIFDSEFSQRIYVLPPETSFAKVKSLHTVTANVGFCKEIAKLQEYNLDTIALINSLKTKDLKTKELLAEQNEKLITANEDLAKYVTANNMQEISSLDLKVLQLEKRLDQLYISVKKCNKECDSLNVDIQNTQQLRLELTSKRFDLSSANLMATNEYEKRKTYVESLQKNVETIQTNWKQIQSDLLELYTDFNRMYDAHAKREGGRVAISYQSNWSDNINRLSRDNPQYRFEKISTKNVNIRMSAYTPNNLLPEGALMAFELGGSSGEANLKLEAFPEALSGNATMNLLGVCPLLHPELFNLDPQISVENMSYGITASYEYPVTMKYNITAQYNLYRMYQVIKSQGTNGGFFSSSSWTHHQEEELFKDSFSVDWHTQDDKMQISFEQKMAINADLRRQMLTRLASYLVMNDQGAKIGAALQTPTTGAIVLANSLSKSCPASVYCQGASIVLNVLQSIFGSSSSQQSVKQITDVNMTEKYSNTQMVLQPRLITFN